MKALYWQDGSTQTSAGSTSLPPTAIPYGSATSTAATDVNGLSYTKATQTLNLGSNGNPLTLGNGASAIPFTYGYDELGIYMPANYGISYYSNGFALEKISPTSIDYNQPIQISPVATPDFGGYYWWNDLSGYPTFELGGTTPYSFMGSSTTNTQGHMAVFGSSGKTIIDGGAPGTGGGGSSVYPATATASFPYGASFSTFSMTGTGNAVINDNGLTGSIVISTQSAPTVGHLAVYSSSLSIIDGGAVPSGSTPAGPAWSVQVSSAGSLGGFANLTNNGSTVTVTASTITESGVTVVTISSDATSNGVTFNYNTSTMTLAHLDVVETSTQTVYTASFSTASSPGANPYGLWVTTNGLVSVSSAPLVAVTGMAGGFQVGSVLSVPLTGTIYANLPIALNGNVLKGVNSVYYASGVSLNLGNTAHVSSITTTGNADVLIAPVYNAPTVTGQGYTDLLINRTETNLGTTPGAQNLLRGAVANVTKFVVTHDGWVGISTGAPQGSLEVNGSAIFDSSVSVSSNAVLPGATFYPSANGITMGAGETVTISSAAVLGVVGSTVTLNGGTILNALAASLPLSTNASKVITAAALAGTSLGATQSNITALSAPTSVTFTGTIIASSATRIASATNAVIRGKTPGGKGEFWFCTDCATAVAVCTSTGTTLGSYSLITSSTTACQ